MINMRKSKNVEFFERHLHSSQVGSTKELLTTLRAYCKSNKLEIESLELRNDEYIIQLKRAPRPGLDPEVGQQASNLK